MDDTTAGQDPAETTIRVRCRRCRQETSFAAGALRLRLCETAIERSSYRYACPDCGDVEVPASEDAVLVLLRTDVRVERFSVPLEELEPRPGEAWRTGEVRAFLTALAGWDGVLPGHLRAGTD